MPLFFAQISHIGDRNVPVECPNCHARHPLHNLTDSEKQFLLDATTYHSIKTEAEFLHNIERIRERFPGTNHRLLRGKLESPDNPLYRKIELFQKRSNKSDRAHDYLNKLLSEAEQQSNQKGNAPSDKDVDTMIDSFAGLREFLETHIFNLQQRLEFTRNYLNSNQLEPILVSCDNCDDQYLVFPDEYYLTLG